MTKALDDEHIQYFMDEALIEAKKAADIGEIPIGAVIVKNGEIIARAHNLKEIVNDPLGHAEILAIRQASHHLQNWRLSDCSLFVTLEPCPMCAGALLQARIETLYFGTYDAKAGAVGSVTNLLDITLFNHRVNYYGGIRQGQCGSLLTDFFKKIRQNKIK